MEDVRGRVVGGGVGEGAALAHVDMAVLIQCTLETQAAGSSCLDCCFAGIGRAVSTNRQYRQSGPVARDAGQLGGESRHAKPGHVVLVCSSSCACARMWFG